MHLYSVDINADVGEGIGNESKLLPYLSSCNIACGGHAGNKDTMRKVIRLAKTHKVKIGAHPSFPDKENFGRVKMDISCAALYTSLKHQLSDLLEVLYTENATLHHVKPHGALYNMAAVNKRVAQVVVELIKSMQYPVQLYVPYKSVIATLALENGISIAYEVFADRNYNDDLSLVSRKAPNALITDAEKMKEHVLKMVTNKKVITVTGIEQSIFVNTICVHGDNENAIKLVKKLHKFLVKNHIKIQ